MNTNSIKKEMIIDNTKEFIKEGNNMSQETDKTTKESTKVIREIDYSFENPGPLFIPARLKKPGFVYKFVSNEAGNIETEQRKGYDVVIDDELLAKAGSDRPSTSSPFGSAFTVQSKCGALLVLMAVSQELHDRYMAHVKTKNDALTAELHRNSIPGVPEANTYGSVKFESK